MSILDRINLLIRSELSDLTRGDRFRSAISDMEKSLRDARRQQIEVRRGEERLVRQIREAREKADQWEERAVLALKNGDEDLAREALIVKNKALDEAERLRDELEDQRSYLEDIGRALQALEMKLEGARARIESTRDSRRDTPRRRIGDEDAWEAEMRRRQQARRSGDTSASSAPRPRPRTENIGKLEPEDEFGATEHFREFDRMSSKINAMEADIEAMRELSGDDWADPRRRELEDIFKKMESKRRTDDDLSDLKKKFED